MLVSRHQSLMPAFSSWYLLPTGLLLTLLHGANGSKGFTNCSPPSKAPYQNTDCSYCICDCPLNVTAGAAFRKAYLKFSEVRGTFAYNESSGECRWSVDRLPTGDGDNITVTLQEWAEDAQIGSPLPECCGVPFRLGSCKATISAGSDLWLSMNIEGHRMSPMLPLYQRFPVEKFKAFCGKAWDYCIRLNLFTGRMVLLKHSLFAYPYSGEPEMLGVCTTTISKGLIRRIGNETDELSGLVSGSVYEMQATIVGHTIAVGESTRAIDQPCDFRISADTLENAVSSQRGDPFCFFFRGEKMESTTLYCVYDNEDTASSFSWTAVTVGVTAASILVVAIVVVLVYCRRKPKQPKGEIVYHTWRRVDERPPSKQNETTVDKVEKDKGVEAKLLSQSV